MAAFTEMEKNNSKIFMAPQKTLRKAAKSILRKKTRQF
jgi:hypothetical protein